MLKKPKVYSLEFKMRAVRLVETSGKSMSQIARDLDIADSNLYRWCKQFMKQDNLGMLGAGVRMAQEEVQQLRIEIETLRQERDALKRTVGIFSREHL